MYQIFKCSVGLKGSAPVLFTLFNRTTTRSIIKKTKLELPRLRGLTGGGTGEAPAQHLFKLRTPACSRLSLAWLLLKARVITSPPRVFFQG